MPTADEEEDVLTPGGMRPASQVHHVGPEEMVTGEGKVAQSAEAPEGQRPVSGGEPPPAGGGDAGEEPPGMRPDSSGRQAGAAAAPAPAAPAAAGELVLTPGGYRHQSLVHHIEPEHRLDFAEGAIRKLHVSGHEVADLGVLRERPGGQPLMPANVAPHPTVVPALGSGWIAYAYWTNNTGHPVTRFATTWVVPPPPQTNHNQTIFLFNGIQNATMIYQPVLQWGPSAAGGGAYWSVASWYVDGQGGPAFHTNLVRVNPGDVLLGVMTQTG